MQDDPALEAIRQKRMAELGGASGMVRQSSISLSFIHIVKFAWNYIFKKPAVNIHR